MPGLSTSFADFVGEQDPADPQVRRELRDIVALSTLPAIWSGAEPRRIAESLAAALFTTLDPEFVYVSFNDSSGQKVVQVAQTDRYQTSAALAEQIGAKILEWARAHDPDDFLILPNSEGAGIVYVHTRQLGADADLGVIAAGFTKQYRYPSFCHLVLNVAASQAITGFQNARLFQSLRQGEERLRRVNAELSERVAELQHANVEIQNARRAALDVMEDAVQARKGLEALNSQLNQEILERKRAEEVQRTTEQRLRELNDTLERRVEERSRALEEEMAERRKAEDALQQAHRLEAIGQLTGGVAHDFNNLLTVVAGQAEAIINKNAGRDEQIARMAAAIEHAVDRGARLTAQLLAFSRRQTLRPTTVTLNQLTNVEDLVRRAAGEAIQMDFSADPDLWPTLVDVGQFESAILNLVINARDAMSEGGRITINARNAALAPAEATRLDVAPGDYIVVSVSDTGVGMPADVRERAFEPFFTTKDVGKGTGLGLAQIYGFVKQSGGAATIESTTGSGTTVSLYLPRSSETPAVEDGSLPGEPERLEGSGRTVLVVEDQEEVRDVIRMFLEGLGYRTLTAPDGVAACEIVEGVEAIDLLLTDIVMPNGMSGVDLARTARHLRQNLRIVLVSGYSRDDNGRAAGIPEEFVFLKKPFRRAELAAALEAAFSRGARGYPW